MAHVRIRTSGEAQNSGHRGLAGQLHDGSDLAEMYNLRDDPYEMRNLWNNPDYIAVQADLMERMAREMIYYTDLSPAPRRRA